MNRPEPFTPHGCDVSGLDFLPLDGNRLIASELFTLSTGDEFKAAVALWIAAWNQMPAGSLPNDDRVLARAAGYGRDVKGFLEVRTMAMHGFVLCSDGRFYHRVVCEKALTAWAKCTKQQAKANRRWDLYRAKQAELDLGDKPKDDRSKMSRAQRIAAAKAIGTHTEIEWQLLKVACGNRCVSCGGDRLPLERDHIKPVYQSGSSDLIDNIQPMCARCNASKGPDNSDLRPHGWKQFISGELCRIDATASKFHATAKQLEPEREQEGESTVTVEENLTVAGNSLRENPAPTPSKPKKPKNKRATSCEAFDMAWSAWPRKDRSSKAKALEQWRKCDALGADKVSAVLKYLNSKDAKKDNYDFVPALERWLRDKLQSWLEMGKAQTATAAIVQAAKEFRADPSWPEWWTPFAAALFAADPAAWKSYGAQAMPFERDGEFFISVASTTAEIRLKRDLEPIEKQLRQFVYVEGPMKTEPRR